MRKTFFMLPSGALTTVQANAVATWKDQNKK